MRTLLNLIWLVLCGFWMAVGYAVAGLFFCVLIVTLPLGLAALRMADFALWPFGRVLVDRPGAGAPSTLGNIVWIVLAGWWLALGHLVTGVLLCITIVGIPLGIANFKLLPVSLVPLGKQIVDRDALVGAYRVGF
ncbi:YccF domain-containing protein [Pseudonocardia sp. GCM10023141]|uniref:YccF domain-containing protein n=1 Tax=Pseudonocardia sp. GCM10023141 TaxID=3252653 RepID=UPI0036112779